MTDCCRSRGGSVLEFLVSDEPSLFLIDQRHRPLRLCFLACLSTALASTNFSSLTNSINIAEPELFYAWARSSAVLKKGSVYQFYQHQQPERPCCDWHPDVWAGPARSPSTRSASSNLTSLAGFNTLL